MNRQPVKSSNVTSVGWEPSDEDPTIGTLEVEFNNGKVYQYLEVPELAFETLMGASSVGRYLNQNIIGSYAERRAA